MQKYGPVQREVKAKSKQWTWNFLDILWGKTARDRIGNFWRSRIQNLLGVIREYDCSVCKETG